MTTQTAILTPEDIRRIALASGCDPELDDGALVTRLCLAAEQAVLQSPEVQAWKRDAERWRMLPAFAEEYQLPMLRLFDQIDAAMEKQP